MSFFRVDYRGRLRRGWCIHSWAALLLVFFLALGTGYGADSNLELAVKSAYIYNFLQFINWQKPEGSVATRPIKICMIGSDPLGIALTELTTRQVKGRPIQVQREAPDSDALAGCQVVVIGRSAKDQLSGILKQLSGVKVLTVSDIPHFARIGGGIGFVLDKGKVKIEINSQTIRQAGLEVSAKLMEVAIIVQ
jgi:hypothetical protein